MTIAEILKELEPYTGRFPMLAMRAAVEQRAAITPELLRVLDSVAAAPSEWAGRTDNMLPMFAIFLLAQFRERSAYRLLVKIVRAPGDVLFVLFGDTITQGLSQILASVYDGNTAPLQGLVESEEVNEFVRSAAVKAFLVLEQTEQLPRETVLEYFGSLFHGKLERTPSFAWTGLVCAVADLPAPELLEDVRQAYAEGLAASRSCAPRPRASTLTRPLSPSLACRIHRAKYALGQNIEGTMAPLWQCRGDAH